MIKEIKEFQGKYRFLSNFWYCKITYSGIEWPSVEHAFQGMKCIDSVERKQILNAETPGAAKRKGGVIRIRADWEDVKLFCMLNLLKEKFKIPYLRAKLLSTGNAKLQEGNYWRDTFWGVDLKTGKGENHLGKLLMQVRGEIRKEIHTKVSER